MLLLYGGKAVNNFDDISSSDIKTKNRGILYFFKKWFKILPYETIINSRDRFYSVKIRISEKQMGKIVDKVCKNAIISSKL